MTAPRPLLLMRMWSWKPEKLVVDARTEHDERVARGEFPDFSFSTWGRRLKDGESIDDALKDICSEVQMNLGNRIRHASYVLAEEVGALGFAVRSDAREEELAMVAGVPCHYDVVLGTSVDEQIVVPLVELLDQRKVTRPCGK